MHIRHKKTCRVCKSPSLKPVIDLQPQYLQGSFVKAGTLSPPLRKIPTSLVRCDVSAEEGACGLLQLQHSIPPEILYANYWYRSGTNRTMRDHLQGIVHAAMAIVAPNDKRVLDIGCNDGTLLATYPKDFELWGFDPSDIAQEITDWVQVVGTTFPSSQGRARIAGRKFDVITSIAMFYDLEDPIDFASNIKQSLADDGIWILEMSYMPLMLKMNSFDTICHEHLEYYSLEVLHYIARAAGLRIFRAELNAINGGSIRCYVCHESCIKYDTREADSYIRRLQLMEFEMQLDTDEPYRAFQGRIERLREDMNKLMGCIRANGETVHVYGASTKGNVLLQWYNIDTFKIEYAADRNPQKNGAQTLGTNIKIISEEKSRAMKPDYYLVLPWHFRREFIEREAETIRNGTKMLFPLPTIEVVDATNLEASLEGAELTPNRLEEILGI
ncbi:C-methyltransferase [Candidatus Filomicrobium marinum]|uniref:C-methyltransferase n=3 Tax=Hyphomicrobiaceae TaxID=45401 RepID=A0A0D6JJQ3_9HYPH|nr:class I SAM-dependent methyltransferase [Filomicrobium sp.]CFX56054.1 C-methyltransferase [Candidatus Filomicrobium marinum]CPR22219.1 C-methyltransferase [Candidatus Filomicrobium marinum]SDO92186.1 Methyltransferase domain-containing protein [Filomicrobium insigne]